MKSEEYLRRILSMSVGPSGHTRAPYLESADDARHYSRSCSLNMTTRSDAALGTPYNGFWSNFEAQGDVMHAVEFVTGQRQMLPATMESTLGPRSVSASGNGSGTGTARVCEKCMIKKRKCNRQRPTCSRCLEDNIVCVYTSAKRKPGPAKGYKKAKPCAKQQADTIPLGSLTTPDQVTTSNGVGMSGTSLRQSAPSQEFEFAPSNPSSFSEQLPGDYVPHNLPLPSLENETISSYTRSFSSASAPIGLDNLHHFESQITPDQAHQMLEGFFEFVHPSICLFDKQKLMRQHETGTLDPYLRGTILAITSHVQGLSALWTYPSLKSCLNQLLSIDLFEVDPISGAIPLSRFQQAVILTFYSFHQYPGKKSWLRVSELTREAYAWGLHQLDNPDQCPLYVNNMMDFEEKENWRRLWWSIYCLDSYCNMTSRTPFVIELDGVRTALFPREQMPPQQEALFLPSNTSQLWEICQVVSARPGDYNINMHILTTTLLRKAGTLVRLWLQNPTPERQLDFVMLNEHLSAVRLALPPKFFDVSRDIVRNESPAEHHARLICNLHMYTTRLLVTSPRSLSGCEESWRRAWSANLECCEDVVLIVQQWKSQLCPSVDPAICLIIVSVLMLLHLHAIDINNSDSVEFLARLHGQKEMLRLLLEQFAAIWHLPRFLTVSYQKFLRVFSGPLTSTEIAAVMSQMGGALLNQNWMRLLSLTSDHLKPPEDDGFDLNGISAEDFRDWEF